MKGYDCGLNNSFTAVARSDNAGHSRIGNNSSNNSTGLGSDAAAANAAVSVLFNLHRHPQLRQAPIQVLYDEKTGVKRVIASEDIRPRSLVLAPCQLSERQG